MSITRCVALKFEPQLVRLVQVRLEGTRVLLERAEQAATLEQLLARHRVRLYLHGHTHRHILANLQPSGLPVILDSGCCAQKNGTWNLLTIDENGIQVDVYKYKTLSHSRKIAWTRGLKKD